MRRGIRWLAGLVVPVAFATVSHGIAAEPVRFWNRGTQITTEPKMYVIPNTDVTYQRRAPGYDLYRYADRWYLVDDGEWFTSERWTGPYVTFDVETLPEQVQFIPEEYRKFWERGSKQSWASPIKLEQKPEMKSIRGTGVSVGEDLTGYDLYRYRSEWYLMEDGQWFHSDSWKGPFMAVPASEVPSAVRNVPVMYRRYWQTSAIG